MERSPFLSLHWRLLLAFMLLLLIPGVTSSYYFIQALQQELRQNVERAELQRISNNAQEMASRLENTTSEVLYLAQHPSLRRYMNRVQAGADLGQPRQDLVASMSRALSGTVHPMSGLCVVDNTGMAHVCLQEGPGVSGFQQVAPPNNWWDNQAYQGALQLTSIPGGSVPVYVYAQDFELQYATQLIDENGIIAGVLIIEIDWPQLAANTLNEEIGNNYFLLNAAGELYPPERPPTLAGLGQQELLSSLSSTQQKILWQPPTLAGYIVSSARVAPDGQINRWTLIQVTPASMAQGTLQAAQVRYIFLLVGITALTLPITYIVTRQVVVVPVRHLTQVANRLEGDPVGAIRDSVEWRDRQDEIGSLHRAFWKMASRLQKLLQEKEQQIEALQQAQVSLEQAQQRFSAVFKQSPTAISISHFETGELLDVNDSYARMVGYARDELIGADPVKLGIWLSEAERQGILQNLADDGQAEGIIVPFRRRDREIRQATSAFSQVKINDQTVLISLTSDTTETVVHNQAIRHQNWMLYFSKAITDVTNRETHLQGIMERILGVLHTAIGFEDASIVLKHEGKCTFAATYGSHEADMLNSQADDICKEEHYRQKYDMSGMPVIIDDVSRDDRWLVMDGREITPQAWLGVPLLRDEILLGFLNMNHSVPGYFTMEHKQLVRTVTGQIAVAIRKAQLFQQNLQEIVQRREMETTLKDTLKRIETLYMVSEKLASSQQAHEPTLESICQFLLQAVDHFDAVSLYTSSVGQETLHLCYPEQNDVMHQVATMLLKTGPIESTGKHPHPGGIIGYTMIDTDGILLVNSSQNTLSHNELSLIQGVAHQLQAALLNWQLDHQLRTYMSNLEKMVETRTHELNLERQRLAVTLSGTGEGICYLENYLFGYVNPAFQQLVGYAAEDLLEKPFAMLFVVGGSGASFVQKLEEGSDIITAQLRHQNGALIDVAITVRKIKTNEAASDHVLVVRDISEEKRLQAQKDRFIADAAHELRSPITSLSLRMHLLKKQPDLFDKHLAVIDRSVEHVRHLVEDLLDLSRFERGTIKLNQVQPTDITTLLAETVEDIYLQVSDITLRTTLPDTPLILEVDAHRMRQVITNLVSNAIHYTPAGGEVCVSLVPATASTHQVRIIVQDTGTGIAADQLDSIFEPFVRLHTGEKSGNGLGLAISQRIVQLHGGHISVESTPGVGSTFTIALAAPPPTPGNPHKPRP